MRPCRVLRLFIALGLPHSFREDVSFLGLSLPGARCVDSDQAHLTLRFLGELREDQAEDVVFAMNGIRHAPVVLTPKGVGCFPKRKAPRVLWVGIEPNAELSHLQRRLERALVLAGLPPEGRKFHPHVTVARLGEAPSGRVALWMEEHALFSAPSFVASELLLFASDLSPSGARHELLHVHALDGDLSEPR